MRAPVSLDRERAAVGYAKVFSRRCGSADGLPGRGKLGLMTPVED
jgi:hypothetical protein